MNNKVMLMDTSFARENGLDQGIRTMLRYLVDNRHVVLSPMDLQTIYATKLYTTSPTNTIFAHIQAEGLLDEYTLIDTTLSDQSTPELLTITDITCDMKQLPNASMVLATLKEFKNKIVVNIAPLLSRSREGIIRLNDVNELHNQIVRGALVSSYFNSNDSMWLNPNLLKYIAQTYSMCISTKLQNTYQLDLPSQITMATALTWYIMQRMTDNADDLTIQCDYLGSRLQVRQMLEMFKDTIDDPHTFNIQKLCDLLAVCGPNHMKGFNIDILTRMVAKMGSSGIAMLLALEYPPYWVHQILFALSGNKVSLNYLLNKNKLLKTAGQFLHDLDISRQFISSVGYVTKGMSSLAPDSIYSSKDGGFKLEKKCPIVVESISPEEKPTLAQKQAVENVTTHDTAFLEDYGLNHLFKKHDLPLLEIEQSIQDHCTLAGARIARDGTIYYRWLYTNKDTTCELVEQTRGNYHKLWLNLPGTDDYLDIFGTHHNGTLQMAPQGDDIEDDTVGDPPVDLFQGYAPAEESAIGTIGTIAAAIIGIVVTGFLVKWGIQNAKERAILYEKLKEILKPYIWKMQVSYKTYDLNYKKFIIRAIKDIKWIDRDLYTEMEGILSLKEYIEAATERLTDIVMSHDDYPEEAMNIFTGYVDIEIPIAKISYRGDRSTLIDPNDPSKGYTDVDTIDEYYHDIYLYLRRYDTADAIYSLGYVDYSDKDDGVTSVDAYMHVKSPIDLADVKNIIRILKETAVTHHLNKVTKRK